MSLEATPRLWIERGDQFFNLKNYTDALYAYGEGLKEDPNSVELLSKTGNAFFCLELYIIAENFYMESINQSNSYYLLYQYCMEDQQKNNISILRENLSKFNVIITVEGLEYIISTIKQDQEHQPSQPTNQPYIQPWEYDIVNLIRQAGVPFPSGLLDIAHHIKHAAQKPIQRISPMSLKRLTGLQFEMFLSQFFQNLGFDVERLQRSHDMGGDLLLKKQDEIIVVQAKHRRHKTIGVKAIQEVFAASGYYKTTRALVITTSRFTGPALELANTLGVECWDWERLLIELRNHNIYYPTK